MFQWTLYRVALLAIFVTIGYSMNICRNADTGVSGAVPGNRERNSTFMTYSSRGFMDCCRICQLHNLCHSVNVQVSSSMCELNANTTGQHEVDADFIFVDLQFWTTTWLGPCANHDCLLNQICSNDEISGTFTCVTVGCRGSPVIEFVNSTSFESRNLWSPNETVTYPCIRGYYPTTNPTCTVIGNWTTFDCVPFTKCSQVRDYVSEISGDYLLRPFTNESGLVKIYCAFETSQLNFVTLPEINVSFKSFALRDMSIGTCASLPGSAAETHFQKIRLNTLGKYIVIGNFQFANSTGEQQLYGSAGDCFAIDGDTCGAKGWFNINLNGTGIIIDPIVHWKFLGNGTYMDVIKTADGLRVDGYCGGQCGSCKSSGRLWVLLDPTFIPEDEALFPHCRSV